MCINKIFSNQAYMNSNVVQKVTEPISVAIQKLESNGGGSRCLEAQGAYNKASFNIAQKTLAQAKQGIQELTERFKKLTPDGFDYFYNADGKLSVAKTLQAKELAKEAYFDKFTSQIEADGKAVETFTNELANLFTQSDKLQMDEVCNLSQKRIKINPKGLNEAKTAIGLDSADKTETELVKNVISYIESKKGNVSEEDAKKILDGLRKIDSEKIEEQSALTKKLENATKRLAADKKALASEEEVFKKRAGKITSVVDNPNNIQYQSLDGLKQQEVKGETILVSKKDVESFKKLQEKYDFLSANDVHVQHRMFQRFGGATADGAPIDEKAIVEVLDKIEAALNQPLDKLLEGMPDVNNPTPKLGIFLSNGQTSRGGASLLLPAGDGTFENIILNKDKKMVTIISGVSAASVKKNFVPTNSVKAILV